MNQRQAAMLAGVLVAASAGGIARAVDPFGFYVGGGIGGSGVRLEQRLSSNPSAASALLDFSEHPTGWTVLAGVRPVSVLGAEIAYTDFGHPSASYSLAGQAVAADVHATSTSLSGLFYLPIPLPVLDIYARVGLSHLNETASVTGNGFVPFSASGSQSRLGYGAGVQLRLAGVGIRADYQRVSARAGDPDMFSLGVLIGF